MNDNNLTLTQIFDEEGGDKGSHFFHKGGVENLAHNYTSLYDKIMHPHRHEEINFLEIGLWCSYFPGASVRAWCRYFTAAQYYGIDIVDCRHLSGDRINISLADQRNKQSLATFIEDKPKFKFVIDDGCHEEDAIVISLGALFPHLERGGVYFIEDLHVVDKTRLFNLKTKNFHSDFISQDQLDYINANISECSFSDDGKMCCIYKS